MFNILLRVTQEYYMRRKAIVVMLEIGDENPSQMCKECLK